MTVKNQRLLGQLATALVCLVMLIAFLISGIRLFGFQVYGVLSGSMEPTYPTGSLIYVRKVDPEELKLRDVITFQVSRSTIATHRIIEIVSDPNNPASKSFRTQGDANDSPDANLVSPGSIIGRVSFCIPYMGSLASYIQSPQGTVVTLVFCLVLVGFVFYTDTLERDNGRKRKKNRRKASASGTSQRNIRQSASSDAQASRVRKRQTEQAYMHQEYHTQGNAAGTPYQRGAVRQEYYGAQVGYQQHVSRQQYNQRGYVQPTYTQQGYPRAAYAPQNQTRVYNGQQSYGDRGDYRSEYAAQRYPQQNTVQRQYPQQGYVRQGYSQQGHEGYARQGYPRQDEAWRGASQGCQQSRPQQSAQPTSHRENETNTRKRTNPHSWSYGNDRDDEQ